MSDQPSSYYLVTMEIKRVQTYLFASPRLSVMLGANITLGEVSRGQLTQKNGEWCFEPAGKCLPALAAKWEAALPLCGVWPEPFAPGDPLQNEDDPRISWEKLGVLVRDASRLEAVFHGQDKAEGFIADAQRLLAQELPGVLLDVRVKKFVVKPIGDKTVWKAEEQPPATATLGQSVLDLPQFRVCEETRLGPAGCTIKDGRPPTDKYVSHSVKARQDKAASGKATLDVLGLLKRKLDRRLADGLPDGITLKWPQEFNEVAPSGRLAVIHADGNSMGQRYDERVSGEEDFFKKQAEGEDFYHTMRVAVRRAFVEAFAGTFKGDLEAGEKLARVRARPLMLAGDDMLLVCDAPHALPFLCKYTRLVEEYGSDIKLTIGAGVAIVPASFPFHRAHALAEDLASSAKRLYRGLEQKSGGCACSVVDWLATTDAWHGDIKDTRRDHARHTYKVGGNQETLVLSRKPYPILSRAGQQSCNGSLSLEDLLDMQKELKGAARSQLKGLAEAMPRGRRWAELAFDTLAPRTHDALKAAFEKHGDGRLWVEQDSHWLTVFLDLLELYDLERLKPRTQTDATEAEEGQ